MRPSLLCLLIITVFSACASPEDRELAALEEELGLDVAPYFPKCLSEEVSPRAAVRAGDYNIANIVNDPQGDVAIDKCARWETDEPTGNKKEEPQKLDFRYPDENTSEDSEGREL